MTRSLFCNKEGKVANIIAIGYTLIGYLVGIALLICGNLWLNIIGIFVVAHSLIYSAYFIHEFVHGTVFKTKKMNYWYGTIMAWLNGSCYASFIDLRKKHMRHHRDRADVITFDYKSFLRAGPSWLCNVVLFLEWAYIPAVEFIMRGYVMILPFIDSTRVADRKRIISVLVLRLFFFAVLAWVSLKALVLYIVAYLIFITVLRFVDSYQHTYDAIALLEEGCVPDNKIRDRAYEQNNTYSNLVSMRYPFLNVILLNFSYHNAHHEKPGVSWYRLPSLHLELYGEDRGNIIPMSRLLLGFHKYRVKRILSDDYGKVTSGVQKADEFYGAVGVSFLTAV